MRTAKAAKRLWRVVEWRKDERDWFVNSRMFESRNEAEDAARAYRKVTGLRAYVEEELP